MRPPRVSIIIPAWNMGHLLGETLAAIQAQTITDFECIVVDDHSSDDTGDVARSYAKLDARIQVHLAPAGKPTREVAYVGDTWPANHALTLARGTYVARMDADDLPRPRWLEVVCERLDQGDLVGVGVQRAMFGDLTDYSVGQGRKLETDPMRWRAWSLFTYECQHSGFTWHRGAAEIAPAMRYAPVAINNDWLLITQLNARGPVANVPDVLVDIRRHATNTSTKNSFVVEDRDSLSVAIRRAQIKHCFGIDPSEDEMLLHCTAYPAPYWTFADQAYVWARRKTYLSGVHNWFERLERANRDRKLIALDAFDDVVWKTVFKGCCAAYEKLPVRRPAGKPFRMGWLPQGHRELQT